MSSAAPATLWSLGPAPALLASQDRTTGEIVFPAVPDQSPLADSHRLVRLEPLGAVYSFSVIHPSVKSGLSPYALGLVDLPGPVRIFGRLQGKDRPQIGDAYRVAPDATFGYVFHYAGPGETR
jgi:uncharacterized OB-fold protein